MKDSLRLGREEVVAERPFSSPDHIVIDKVVLRTMIDEIHRHLFQNQGSLEEKYAYFFPSESRWQKRLLLLRPEELQQRSEFVIVGFFGKISQVVDSDVQSEIFNVGKTLCQQLWQIPEILGYSTWLLADELNYANLVVLKNEEAIAQWRHTNPHIRAKDILSPKYYDCVRIYNGRAVFDQNLETHIINFLRVKYWDYRVSPTWHAVRQLEMAR
ncbi:MAG: hypothetical protein AAF490_00290 [Chloroflexota bacterium]